MRRIPAILIAALLTGPAVAQNTAEWAYWAGVDFLFMPEGGSATAPVVMADRGRLHLEARVNYEGDRSGSVWGGYNVKAADGASWVVTPMLGVVFGDTRGVAPGLEAAWCWKALDFYTEAEHLFAPDDATEEFTYVWSELALSPTRWLRAGVAGQWTSTAGAEAETQRGVLLGVTVRAVTVTGFLFEPRSEDETFVLTAAVGF